jgi:hypothetical protein
MSEKAELKTCKGGGHKIATLNTLNLETLEDSRESFAFIINKYAAGEISEKQGRAFTYMLANYLKYWQVIKDVQIEERLDLIEERINGGDNEIQPKSKESGEKGLS